MNFPFYFSETIVSYFTFLLKVKTSDFVSHQSSKTKIVSKIFEMVFKSFKYVIKLDLPLECRIHYTF